MDAGQLTTAPFREGLFVAASLAAYRENGLKGLFTEFGQKNCEQLGISRDEVCDHPLSREVTLKQFS